MKQSRFSSAGKQKLKSFQHGQDDSAAVDATPAADGSQATEPYSDEAVSELLYMIEEEKLAGDIYEAFYDLYGVQIFDNIARSEDKHFDALVGQADKLGIDTDQFVLADPGEFTNPELQDMYDTLLADGSQSVTDAFEVGLAIEEKDMVDIAAAVEQVEGTQLAEVYDNLLTGSGYHLDAFALMLA